VTERRGRNAAEWVALVASTLVLAVVVALAVAPLFGTSAPARPVVQTTTTSRAGGQHHVTVEVENRGDETAANVQVTASLMIDGETVEAEQTVDFLAGSEVEELVFVFADDPAEGELTVAVGSFAPP
jgi:uncharacterized protein (TIGR02588 family)